MAELRITEYTDPGCPWAFSAEPFRRRLDWLYGDAIEWEPRMVVLADSPDEYLDKGFDLQRQTKAFSVIANRHGMPIDVGERPRMAATAPACRAVVAARRHAPEQMRGLLRALRVHHFAGDALLDEPRIRELAAADAGLDAGELEQWMTDPGVEEALEADRTAARSPSSAALALEHKLAGWEGGQRYTCPSYEITRTSDGAQLAVPGFQPFAAYEVAVANLAPELERRSAPESAQAVLEWAGEPLATQEVAVVMDVDRDEAREQLGRAARERTVGEDGFWSLG